MACPQSYGWMSECFGAECEPDTSANCTINCFPRAASCSTVSSCASNRCASERSCSICRAVYRQRGSSLALVIRWLTFSRMSSTILATPDPDATAFPVKGLVRVCGADLGQIPQRHDLGQFGTDAFEMQRECSIVQFIEHMSTPPEGPLGNFGQRAVHRA
jgi:hypothetical protein